MEKMAKKAAQAPAKKEEKKKPLVPEDLIDLSKKFPGKGYKVSGKVVAEEEIKEAEVRSKRHVIETKIAKGSEV